MRGRKVRTVEEAQVDLTPMLDVVFILLIFFIVTAVFLQERAIDLEPPPPPNDQPTEPVPVILILVDEENRVFVNRRPSLVDSVRANIERLKAETPNSSVIIQAHPDAKNGTIIRIRDQAASANIEKVNVILTGV
jgi:biopolymer transport protein ExbD